MSGCGGHSHGGCEDEHSHDPPEMGINYSLYKKINLENVQCLNEAVENSGRKVFKPWEDRLSTEHFVESDVDEELLYNIPFSDQIKLKGIIVIGGEDDHHPSRMRLFKNRPHMTFEEAGGKPDQEFELHRDSTGTLEYATKIVTFSSLTHLTLHFPANFGAEVTKILYIGLKGEYTRAHQHGVTICNYEMSPQIQDLKDKAMDPVGRPVS